MVAVQVNRGVPVQAAANALNMLAGAAGFEPADAGTKNRRLMSNLMKLHGLNRAARPVWPGFSSSKGLIGSTRTGKYRYAPLFRGAGAVR